jgi:hypothetical protein
MSASPEKLASQLKEILAFGVRKKLEEDNISISTFARRIRTGRISIRRLLDPKNTAITLRTMTKAAYALGLDMTLSVRPRPLDDLIPLAEKYASTKDDAEAARLEDQFIAGYYGRRIDGRTETPRLTANGSRKAFSSPKTKETRRSKADRHAKNSTGQPASRSSPTPAGAGSR